MATPVLMPKQGNSVESCIIVQWLKNAGDAVSTGEPICEIETDKSTFEVEAPTDGTLVETFFAADDDVPVMVNIAAIGDAGEDVSALRPSEAGAASDAPAAEAAPAAAAIDSAPTAPAAAAPVTVASGSSTAVSPRARNLASEKGVDASALQGSGPEGRVIERDVQAAAAAGPQKSAAASAALAGGGLEAPAQGSGIGGMVLQADLQAAGTAASAGAAASAPAPGSVTEIPVKGIRKVIAERMHASLQNSAQLTMTASFCAESLLAYRKQLKAQAEQLGLPNITINDMIVFAVSRVLKRHPQLNAHYLGDKILQFADVHIGVAVDTERGLLVPVLRNADQRSLASISQTFKPLAIACQEGKASPDDLQGGTFTITNLGALGIETFTPVLNVPEVAILGVGGLQLKPYPSADGEVVFKQSISLSLTIDHQATDGAPGARFLNDLVASLENFNLVLAN